MYTHKTIGFIGFIILLFTVSCGYKFSGSNSLPFGIKRVYIKILENRTSEIGAENIFTSDLIYELTNRGHIIVSDYDNADAILSGIITSIPIETISHRGTNTSDERRISVLINILLTDSKGKVISSMKDVSENQAFSVYSDKYATEQNKRTAIIYISKRISQRIYNNLTENF